MLRLFSKLFSMGILVSVMVTSLSAQRSARETALSFLRENPSVFNLSAADVSAVRVTDEYVSKHNGVTHVWLQQEYLGTPVYNGLLGLHVLSDGTVKYLGHRFVPGLSGKVNTAIPSLTATQALDMALSGLDFNHPATPRLNEKINERNFIFDKGEVSRSNIPVSACYQVSKDGNSVRLAWTMTIEQSNTSDMWTIRIDAQTGELLDRHNLTVYCGAGHTHRSGETCKEAANTPLLLPEGAGNNAAGSYRVFALPLESPAHGDRALLLNPANATASPYGWHDTNGATGNEYNYTRGNNTWAYNDAANDNTGAPSESADGGALANFDFPYDANGEPDENANSAITNLFYMNNMMHDITYLYGFNESAGNFQTNNYSKGGVGGDEVQAEALDGGGTDNANFATPSDGSKPRMQMYKWSRSGGNLVNVNAPSNAAGNYYGQAAGGWGGAITEVPLTADVVVVNTGGGSPTLGCSAPLNNVTGKIVMVDRGSCQFGLKALNVEQAGAVGCIICNFENSTAGMAAGDVGAGVTIPVVMMSKGDCDALRQYAGQSLNITLAQPVAAGPEFLDGDFDNGIIAHEYGHGISNRLTGGPSQAGCLGNEEQMGEGWSDFFSLVTSVRPGDTAAKRRGVGTYVQREPNDGTGIRRYPYSADMSTSPLTFAAVAENTGVHAIGEVWNTMLWDFYWAMVDKYGFDANISNKQSGNGRAIQLVMDGMKMQPCSPGFQDGRDAIIMADLINYSGADTCLISQVFARRGLGKNASQGVAASASDGIENFEPIETCIKELKIKKITSTPTIEAGGVANFAITITNHKDQDATGVVVTDVLPQGLSLIVASNGGTASGGVVTWNLGTVAKGQVINLTYSAQADMNGSVRLYRDKMEQTANQDWYEGFTQGTQTFGLQNTFKVTGESAWKCPSPTTDLDATLTKATPLYVAANKPVLRFWNRYFTQTGVDAGYLEFQKEGEQSWRLIKKDKTFRGGYNGGVSYSTFAIPFLEGFSGNSNGWIHSYVDIKEYDGQNIFMQFHFGSTDDTGGDGWYVDDVELLDLLNYDAEACVNSAQGDQACSRVPEGGVVVNPATSGSNDLVAIKNGMKVQPNPAADIVYVTMTASVAGHATLTLTGADGRLAIQRNLLNINAGESIAFDISTLPAGVYAVRLESATGVSVQKLVVQ